MTRRIHFPLPLSFGHCLALVLAARDTLAAQQAKKPTLYIDKIETGTDEVFVIYSYQTGFPPDADDVMQVARAQCRRLGFRNVERSADPTLRQCTAIGTVGAACYRGTGDGQF